MYLYKAAVKLTGLVEGATYDAYCFGEDMSLNGMDGSPAFPPDPNAVASTKKAGMTTLTHLNATRFQVVHMVDGRVSDYYWAEPATWNRFLPRHVMSGMQRREHLESWSTPMELSGALL